MIRVVLEGGSDDNVFVLCRLQTKSVLNKYCALIRGFIEVEDLVNEQCLCDDFPDYFFCSLSL